MGKKGDFDYRYNRSVDSDHQVITGQHVEGKTGQYCTKHRAVTGENESGQQGYSPILPRWNNMLRS